MRLAAFLLIALLQSSQVARVTSVRGDAEVIRAAGSSAVRPGDSIDIGDRLHAAPGSSIGLTLPSGSILALSENARLELKKLDGEAVVFLSEGAINVITSGRPIRVETRHGTFVGPDGSQDFEVKYSGDGIQIVTAKNATDPGVRTYEAGSISPHTPKAPGDTNVIVYPSVGQPTRGQRGTK
jgi:hypothetical protein